MFDLIAKSEIGNKETFATPFGYRRTVYCDYTASGRSLSFIEDFIRNEVLKDYANTHSTNTVTAIQTTIFRNEARDIIKTCVNASDDDLLLFVGSGVTGAIHKLINVLDLVEPPIVIVSHYEHHSNLLPWRETQAEMIYANEASDGSIDLLDLEKKLKPYKNDNRVKIGSFTAASNITGIIMENKKITVLLHKYGFLSFWDYATAAPHVKIDMNPTATSETDLDYEEQAFKDAVFISTHKFIGGPQTPGILVAKKKLFKNNVPNGCGGGTVVYVTREDHKYLKNEQEREEGGTPAIVESIRAGLVFQLKNAVGVNNILKREHYYTKKAIKFLTKIPNIHILGSLCVERISIFSFLIKHPQTGYYLHSNFVGVLLNDLFGIQTRSGCACAGPYAAYLIGMRPELSKNFEEILIKNDRMDQNLLRAKHDISKAKLLKPGFTRFNLSFFFDENRVDFILNSIKFVAEYGWKFLTLYNFDLESGTYRHRSFKAERKNLSHISYKNNSFNFKKETYKTEELEDCPTTDQDVFRAAFKALALTEELFDISDERLLFSKTISNLRWFLLSSEAYGIIHDISSMYNIEKVTPIFMPKKYFLSNDILDKLYNVYKFNEINSKYGEDDIEKYLEHFYSDEGSIKLPRLNRKKIDQQSPSQMSMSNHQTTNGYENHDYSFDKNSTNKFKYSNAKSKKFTSFPNIKNSELKLSPEIHNNKILNGYLKGTNSSSSHLAENNNRSSINNVSTEIYKTIPDSQIYSEELNLNSKTKVSKIIREKKI